MDGVLAVLETITTIAYVALAIVTFRQWLDRRDRPTLWMLLTIGVLAAVTVAGRFLPEESDSAATDLIGKFLVALVLLFPYFLFRLAASFGAGTRASNRIALAITGATVVWSLVITFPDEGDPRTLSFMLFIYAVLIQWVSFSGIVAYRFWNGGREQPPVARRRMRALAGASIALSVVIVISGTAPQDRPAAVDFSADIISLISVLFFFFAFAPPRWLRAAWRRSSEQQLRRAVMDLMSAVTDEAVVDQLLPHAVGLIGGEGIALLDKDGEPLGTFQMEESDWAPRGAANVDDPDAVPSGITKLEFPFGCMVVKTGPYTPFFGRDEVELLGSLGVMANFALERVHASELRLELSEAQLRRQQALQINDNIVQGLAVAKYALDLNEGDKAREAVEGTLAAARSIISDLMDEIGDDGMFGPSAFVRDRAATGFTKKKDP